MSFSDEKWENFDSISKEIVSSLKASGFERPTKIQAQTLQEYQHYYDFLIASQTGSGKTLAFALPILSELNEFVNSNADFPNVLFGLIMTPTRQLAQQIESNIKTVLSNFQNNLSVVSIIGGMSKQKQIRIIRQRRPQIIIGTPGRLAELLEDEVLNFQYLKYLVLDEADRMIELGHYVEVDKILQKIFRPKKKEFFEKDFHSITQSLTKRDSTKQGSLYIKKNGKKQKLNFDLHNIESDKLFEVPADMFQFVSGISEPIILTDTKKKKQKIDPQSQAVEEEYKKQEEPTLKAPQARVFYRELNEQEEYVVNKLKRRVFFVSATLTRQFKGQKYKMKRRRQEDTQIGGSKPQSKKEQQRKQEKKKQAIKKGQKVELNPQDLENIPKLKALLSRVNFSSKPKIIDQSSELFLPEGLKETVSYVDGEIDRISLLICYLNTLPRDVKIIIFANTIKVSRRIQFFLQSLDYKTANLHSHMEQKMRMNKLERFKKSTTVNILISTDVAARGLDFFVSHVIQFGVPLNGDTYVHRSGRTARANRTGEALIIIDKKEVNKWDQISQTITASVPDRKVDKFLPQQLMLNDVTQKVNNLEWIRVNQERQKDIRTEKMDALEAEQIGVEVEDEKPKKKNALDQQQEELVRHQLKLKTVKIKKMTNMNKQPVKTEPENKIKWKKNKLILSPQEIMKLM